MLLTGPNATTFSYDPVMRLYQTVSGATTTRFAYDGLDRMAEYNAANALQRRYVHGPAMDEPLVWYEGTGTSNRRFLSSDERGSIVSVTGNAGGVLGLNRYDEYGQPQAGNLGVFGYTGQAWLSTMGLWYYNARVYEPELGRFLQPDPIGYEAGANLYAYVVADPVNSRDPAGLATCTGTRISSGCGAGGIGDTYSGFSSAGVGGQQETGWQILEEYIPLSGLSDEQIRRLAFQFWQFLERGAAQADILLGSCKGRYNCEDWLGVDTARKIKSLLNNTLFRKMFLMSWAESLRVEREVAFGGLGFANFRPTTNLIIGESRSISERDVARIASTGATVFYHTHPNANLFQGISPYDRIVYQKYGFFGIVMSHNGLYFYDATPFRPR